MRESMRLRVFAGLILLAGIATYLPGLSGPLLFDDKPALTANHLVQISGSTFDEWRVAALSSNSGPLRRPIAMMSFAANYALARDFSPFGLKAVNLAIHLCITVLLFFLFSTIIGALAISTDARTQRLLALTAAAIWLLHPLNVSTVLYAVQRMAQLAAMFVVAGLLVFMHYRRRWAQSGGSSGEVLAAGLWLLLLTTLAMLSKENGVLLPWLIAVLEVCIFRGVWAGRSSWYGYSLGWILLGFPVLCVLVFLVINPDALLGAYARREFTLEDRLLTQGRLLWRYLGWICLPNIGDMGFHHDDIDLSRGVLSPWTTALALGAWALVLVAALMLRNRAPLLLLAVLFFLVGHSMESTVIPLEMVYEHRNYLPGVLVCLALAWAVVIPAARSNKVSVWYPMCGVLLIICSLLFVRVQSWSDELTLSRDTVARHPESSRSNYFYANALMRHHDQGEQRGLSDSERTESLFLSRHYFERMYQANNRQVAALAMLYYLDSRHYTRMQDQVDWLAKLDDLLDSKNLQASDWNALAMLFSAFSSEADSIDEARVTALLDKLTSRYPESVRVLRYRYQYLSAIGADSEQLLPLLLRGRELSPSDPWFSQQLIYEYSRSQSIHEMYLYAGLWLLNDPNRYHLHQLKTLFTEPDSSPGSIHD